MQHILQLKNNRHTNSHLQRSCKTLMGHILSNETKEKIGKANKGKIRSKEYCDNISKRFKNKKRSKEFCDKLRQANLGKIATQETKDKISKSKRILSINIIIEIKNLLQKGISQRTISKQLHVSRDTVYKINVGKTYADIII